MRSIRAIFNPAGEAGLVLIAGIVGVVVGLSAAALILLVEFGADALGTHDPSRLPWYVPFLSVPIGLTAAHMLAARIAPEAAGDGVPETAAALAVRAGYLPTRAFFVKLAATALTIGGGGSAGREGPMVQIGGTVGSKAGRMAGLGEDRIRSLVAAGAGAAIGASFNAPIAGMLFALEVILGAFVLRHLNTVVVASVTAAVTARSVLGSERLLSAFAFQLRDARELVLYACLGVVIVLIGVAFLRLTERIETFEGRGPTWLRAPALGLSVAGLAVFAPEVLGDGQSFIAGLVRPVDVETFAWTSLFFIALVKVVVTAATLGARGSGGAFMPALFIGAALGAAFGEILEPVWGFSTLSPGAFAVVGMAASFAAVARAPLTSILIVFEITGDYALVLPLMLATSVATVLADRMEPRSIYTQALGRMGISARRAAEVDLLDTIEVGEVMDTDPPILSPEDSVSSAQALFARRRTHGAAVVRDDELVGLITVSDVLASPDTSVAVSTFMNAHPTTVSPEAEVSRALERMAALGVGRLPVVDAANPKQLVGMFRRQDVIRAYHVALERRSDHEISRQRLGRRTGPDTTFIEFVVPEGSLAEQSSIRDIPWPAGCTVVSIQRDRRMLVPAGDTVLLAGDRLTVYGSEAGHSRLAERVGRPRPNVDRSASGGESTEIQ